VSEPSQPPGNHAWLRALRDLAAIPTGMFMVIHETLALEPRKEVLYLGAFFIVGPGVLRLLGK
jgi:hypothetical protein